MRTLFFILSALVLASCSTVKYYIVRHGEKAVAGAGMTSDVPLSPAGEQRAMALKDNLVTKKIGKVFSTNTIRTRSTVKPTADFFGLTTLIYGPVPDSAFISLLKTSKKNILIAGHSNTVDDIVNKLCGSVQIGGDLRDTQYDNLFVVTKKKDRYIFSGKKYGAVTE